MLVASALIAGTTLLAKVLGRDVLGPPLHPLQVSAGRFIFALIAIAMVAAWRQPDFAGTAWRLHLVRSGLGWAGVTCLFAAAAVLPLAEATALSFLSPVFAMILAALILSERIGQARLRAAALAFVGALLLLQPGTAAFHPFALVALAAAGFMAGESICVKWLSGREPMLRIMLINNAMGASLALAAASLVWQPPTVAQWQLLVLLGLTMACAQALFIAAMQRADASFVMPLFYATLVFAALYDVAIFGELPGALAAVGALVVVAAAVWLTLAERRRAERRS